MNFQLRFMLEMPPITFFTVDWQILLRQQPLVLIQLVRVGCARVVLLFELCVLKICMHEVDVLKSYMTIAKTPCLSA